MDRQGPRLGRVTGMASNHSDGPPFDIFLQPPFDNFLQPILGYPNLAGNDGAAWTTLQLSSSVGAADIGFSGVGGISPLGLSNLNLDQEMDPTFCEDGYNQNLEESLGNYIISPSPSSAEENFETNQMETDLATQSRPGTEDLLNDEGMLGLQVAVEDGTVNIGNDDVSAGKSYITATVLVKDGKKKTISREDVKECFGMPLDDAAKKFGVCRSTLKRSCRKVKIDRWPSHKRNKVNRSLSNQDPSSSNPPTDRAILDGSKATIKAEYKGDIIKFQLSFSADRKDLVEEVVKRLKLETETFKIKYLDGDRDRILIACDADLIDCLTSLGRETIQMFVEPVLS